MRTPSIHKKVSGIKRYLSIYQQLELARHFGPLHRHSTTPTPRIGLEEVHGQCELIIPQKNIVNI